MAATPQAHSRRCDESNVTSNPDPALPQGIRLRVLIVAGTMESGLRIGSGARTWGQAPGKHSGSPQTVLDHSESSRMHFSEQAGNRPIYHANVSAHGTLNLRSSHPASPLAAPSFHLAMPQTLSPRVLRTPVASRDGLPPLGSNWPVLRLRETGGTRCLAELGPSP